MERTRIGANLTIFHIDLAAYYISEEQLFYHIIRKTDAFSRALFFLYINLSFNVLKDLQSIFRVNLATSQRGIGNDGEEGLGKDDRDILRRGHSKRGKECVRSKVWRGGNG